MTAARPLAAAPKPNAQQVPAGYRFVVVIPGLRLVTLSNGPAFARFQKAKISREQKTLVTACLQSRAVRCPLAPPLTVTITRGAPGRMDSDNLTISAKFVRDAVAEYLGVNDRHEHLVDYMVVWEKTPAKRKAAPAVYWCKISIERRAT